MRHHYDVSNEFFELFLGPIDDVQLRDLLARGATTLEEAQEAKLELVCSKLALRAGERVLDVGCGWGSFAIHAAERHGVARRSGSRSRRAQAERARRARRRRRACRTGSTSGVVDYRELGAEPFDAIA